MLAGTLHGIHAITSRLSPMTGSSSGAQVIEGETFKMSIFLTATGEWIKSTKEAVVADDNYCRRRCWWCCVGTKFVLLTSLVEPMAESALQKVYEVYADAVMKNPFHTPEMPIRNEGFDSRIAALLGSSS